MGTAVRSQLSRCTERALASLVSITDAEALEFRMQYAVNVPTSGLGRGVQTHCSATQSALQTTVIAPWESTATFTIGVIIVFQ